jgi:hypothetical protein
MAVIGQRNNFRLGFWAFTLMEESSKPARLCPEKSLADESIGRLVVLQLPAG